MPRIVVCPLSQVADCVSIHQASHMVTLINEGTPVERPASINAERHLFLAFNDIVEPVDGMTAPAEGHARELLSFVDSWDRKKAIVIHCFAGISRSTAAAFISMCALRPDLAEADIARHIRAASPSATPNILLVGLADRILGRDGRMVSAIRSIGRGAMAFEGVPFVLPLTDGA